MGVNIVLDIDGILACKEVRNVKEAFFFKNKGAILTAIKTHYIFPGVIEFIKFLFSVEGLKVSFYSSGAKERGVVFVPELLKICSINKNEIKILSRNDLATNTDEEKNEMFQRFDLRSGNHQKDIKKVLEKGDFLENTILIEDDYTYISYGQAKNGLIVRPTDGDDFCKIGSKTGRYQSNGNKIFEIYLSNKYSDLTDFYINNRIENKKLILLLKKDQEFYVKFSDNNDKIQTKVISPDESKVLIEKLNESVEANFYLKDAEVIKLLCEYLTSLDGQVQTICKKVNRIFYAAGMLFTILEEAKKENISVSESLFRYQYQLIENKKRRFGEKVPFYHKPRFFELSKRDHFYWLGLEILRKFNPKLELINPINYAECINLPITPDEECLLKGYLENQDEGCCIM